MPELNPLNHPVCFSEPKRLTPTSAWHEHIPFAMILVDLLRPKTIVELGTHSGDSYCAFCQAVIELSLDTRCYAVDTWLGDDQAGLYGPEVMEDLLAHQAARYGAFSRLMRMTFDEALPNFADGSIDLLHIDGCHAYESVKHDFDAWLAKVSPRGVVLFHDTNEEQSGYGVKRMWDEIKLKYPHFEFLHGHGLGILSVRKPDSKELDGLFSSTDKEAETIRMLFFRLGQRLSSKIEVANVQAAGRASVADLEATVESMELKIRDSDRRIADLQTQMQQPPTGVVISLVRRYQPRFGKIAPWGSRRRYYYELGMAGTTVLVKEGPLTLWRKYKLRRSRKR